MTKGFCNFGESKREIPQISKKILTQHLRKLESDGLITRTIYPEMPPRMEYALTKLGTTLPKQFMITLKKRRKIELFIG